MATKEIALLQKREPLGGISLRWSHHTNLIGFGGTFEKALSSLQSVYSWERVPFPPLDQGATPTIIDDK